MPVVTINTYAPSKNAKKIYRAGVKQVGFGVF